MPYKLSRGRPKKISEKYYEDKEIQELREKYKGKPPVSEVMRVGTRRTFHVQKIVHRKNHVVAYKNNLAIVKDVSKKGLWIEPFEKDNSGIAVPSGKHIFVPEEKVEHQIYPIAFPNLPIGVVAPYSLATMD